MTGNAPFGPLAAHTAQVYSEMLPCTTKLADLPFKPKGIILSGGQYTSCRSQLSHEHAC